MLFLIVHEGGDKTRRDKTRQDENPKRLVERECLAARSLKTYPAAVPALSSIEQAGQETNNDNSKRLVERERLAARSLKIICESDLFSC